MAIGSKINKMEIEKSGLDSTVLTLVEVLAKDAVCALAPKLITALQKDLENIPDIHLFKKEAVKLLISVIKDVELASGCAV